MKIRIGVGAGGASSTPDALAELVTGLDQLGFDSLWLSEVLTGPVLDPVVGLAWAAASNPRVKLGTTMLLPGRKGGCSSRWFPGSPMRRSARPSASTPSAEAPSSTRRFRCCGACGRARR